MFIDISTYVGHWPFRNLEYNDLNGLDELAREYDITHMVVANLNGLFYKDANAANLELLDELEAYSGKTKFLPLAIVNPTYPEWEKDAREMIARGFCGFELAPLYHGYSLAPEMLYDEYMPIHRAAKVLALAEELDVPVRICAGFENFRGRSEHDTPKNITGNDYFALLSKFEKVHIFITSFYPPAAGEPLSKLIKERDNIYFDTTQIPTLNKGVAKSLKSLVSEKQLCFGSLSPFNYIETNLLRIELNPDYDSEVTKQNGANAFKQFRK